MPKIRILKGYKKGVAGTVSTAGHATPSGHKAKPIRIKNPRTGKMETYKKVKPSPRVWDSQDIGPKAWMETFKWVRVTSSNVKAIRYDKARKEMHVKFKNDGDAYYVYFGVPYQIAVGMYTASSKGRFVWRRLRGGCKNGCPPFPIYPYTKRSG